MTVVILDANAIIMHGRAFPDRVHAVEARTQLVLPQSVKQELVDDVLDTEHAPQNHRAMAQTIQELIDEGYLVLHHPDYEAYSDVIDEARRRIADDSISEHEVKADQYIPALVCEFAQNDAVTLVTADRKLRDTVRTITERNDIADQVTLSDPLTVL